MSESIHPSRADPRTLVPGARALYAQGRTRGEVLQAIYGVDLPLEASLILRDFVDGDKPLPVHWRILPWGLLVPLEDGGPDGTLSDRDAADEARLFAQSPEILPLATTAAGDLPHGGSLLAYDLAELRAGRTTVVGLDHIPELPPSGARFTVFGPSLIAVLRDYVLAMRVQMERWVKMHHASFDFTDVEGITEQLKSLDALQREIDARA